jgi:hypothetical protein
LLHTAIRVELLSSTMPFRRALSSLCLLPLIGGCGAVVPFHPSTPDDVAPGSPLGPSYILVPLPNDDDALLGRILLDVPENGRSLDEVSRPNECSDRLSPKKEGPLASTFEDAQELSAGGKARGALGAFGFEGDAQTATHFYYKLDVNKRVSQTDTTEYVACCKEKGTCGYGFISSLIYGDGQYATAAETSAEGSVTIPVAGGAGGFVKAKILHRRNVHGYVAALVTVTDPQSSKSPTVLGDPAALGITMTEENLPEQVRKRFQLQTVRVEEMSCDASHVLSSGQCVAPGAGIPDALEVAYRFEDGNGAITENEFVRRYVDLTGDHNLSSAATRRNGGTVAVAGTFELLFAAGTVLSVAFIKRHCNSGDGQTDSQPVNEDCTATASTPGAIVAGDGYVDPSKTTMNSFTAVTAAVSGLGALVTAPFLIAALLTPDGQPSDHSIARLDADLYVAKYNRALLRKTIQETKERMQQLSGKNDLPALAIVPLVTPLFVGLAGQF